MEALRLPGDDELEARMVTESGLGIEKFIVRDWRELVSAKEMSDYEELGRLKEEFYRRAKTEKLPEEKLKEFALAIERADAEQKKIIYKYDFARFVDELFAPLEDEIGEEEVLQDKVATPEFHLEMYNAFCQSKRVCVVCPRSHGKSSAARLYILHQILNRKVRYVILIGSSEDMAAQNLRWIRDQLIDNPRIIKLYGNLQNKSKWAETEFVTSTKIKVVAKGAGQKLRGANEKGRPDLVYVDDLEDDENVASRDSRAKLVRWFKEAILPMKSKDGCFIMTGTILHIDSLLRNVAKNMVRDHIKWDVLWYEALSKDKNGKEVALWPAVKPLHELQKLREIDPQTFSQEYQNNPVSGGMAVFKIEWFPSYKKEDVYVSYEKKQVFVHGNLVNVMLHTDLAISEKDGADFTVLAVSGMDSRGDVYWLEVMRFRSSDIFEIIEMIFKLLRDWCCDYVTMEAVAFQKAVQRQIERKMEEEDFYFHIEEMKRFGTTKMARVKGLQSPIRAGKMHFLDEHFSYIEEEFLRMTATRLPPHDDFMDCVADGWEKQIEARAEKKGQVTEVNTIAWAEKMGFLPDPTKQQIRFNLKRGVR
jgi:hypothetical protein